MEVRPEPAGRVEWVEDTATSANHRGDVRGDAINLLATLLLSRQEPYFRNLEPRSFAEGIRPVVAEAFGKRKVPDKWLPAVKYLEELPATRICQLRSIADKLRKTPEKAEELRRNLPDQGASADLYGGSPRTAQDFSYAGVAAEAQVVNDEELAYRLGLVSRVNVKAGHQVTLDPLEVRFLKPEAESADGGPPTILPDGTIVTGFAGAGEVEFVLIQRGRFHFGVAGEHTLRAGMGLIGSSSNRGEADHGG
jgi:hypothetical protein